MQFNLFYSEIKISLPSLAFNPLNYSFDQKNNQV